MTDFEKIIEESGKEVLSFLKDWMKDTYAEDIDFHRYRMKLLHFAQQGEETAKNRIIKLLTRVDSLYVKEANEMLHDKVLGESMAKYMWSKIIAFLNEEYAKILDFELDRVKAETSELKKRTSLLTPKIGAH